MSYRAWSLAISIMLSVSACGPQQQNEPVDNAHTESAVQKKATLIQTPLSGESLFVACRACHNLSDGAAHKVGPNLFGIVDRKAASMANYKYSKALSESGLIWNKSTLAGWILSTETLVPGTWMAYHNHLSPDEVVRLVDYIATQK